MKQQYLFFIFLSIFAFSCKQSSNKRTVVTNLNSGQTNTNSTVTGAHIDTGTTANVGGTGTEEGVADAGQTIEYYKINDPPIIAHGANEGVVSWSSETDLTSSLSQNIFYTDKRFNIRVMARRQTFGTDSKGVSCLYTPRPYEKLQVGVRLRKKGSTNGDYFLFSDVPVDAASPVHEFVAPANTSDPLIVEVLNIQWDWSCTDYANQGFPNVPGVCPYDRVWLTECVQIELQFSTDTTKDIPGPRF